MAPSKPLDVGTLPSPGVKHPLSLKRVEHPNKKLGTERKKCRYYEWPMHLGMFDWPGVKD